MNIPFADAFAHPMLIRSTCLIFIALASCARADSPEQFVADPSLQNDYHSSLPESGSSDGYTYRIVQGYAVFEGDILLGTVNREGKLNNELRARGVGKNDAFSRWPDGIVVYEKPTHLTQEQQEKVHGAIDHWTENTTLSFTERTDENAEQYPHYIQFRDSGSCASHVGVIGGAQPVFISSGCSLGSVIHEIGHAVGLFHEHTRADRDNFIQIDWDQIQDGALKNFYLQDVNTDTYSEYDYGSIMHYGAYFFGKSSQPTIIVNDEIQIGQRDGLSPLDIESVNNMYETDLALGPLASTVNEDGLEIDVTIYNYGTLGAHQLELSMIIDEDSQWTGISSDSGWDCLSYDAELKCTRDTLREQTETRFTVLSDTIATSTDNLSVRLVSRTQDANPDNNTLNAEGVEWHSPDDELRDESITTEEPRSTEEVETLSENDTPDLLAAKQLSTDDSDSVQVDTAAAGSSGLMLLILMGFIGGIRRWR